MFCIKCQTEIPELKDIPRGTESRIRLLVIEGRTMMATAELRTQGKRELTEVPALY